MQITTEQARSKLSEKIAFLSAEIRKLKVEQILTDSPTEKLMFEENIKDAQRKISAMELAIDKIDDGSISNEDLLVGTKEIMELPTLNNISNNSSYQQSRNSTAYYWYKKPIGIIGIGVFVAVIAAFAIYLIKIHFGIPL